MHIDSELEELTLVTRCNLMLAAAGLNAKAHTAEDAKAICSSTSVFVAAFEQLTGRRVRGVRRLPKSSADRVENCRCVLEATAAFVKLDLSHLSAEKIVLGDGSQIASFLELIVAIPKNKNAVVREADHSKGSKEGLLTTAQEQKPDKGRSAEVSQTQRKEVNQWEESVANKHKQEHYELSRDHSSMVHVSAKEYTSVARIQTRANGKATKQREVFDRLDSDASASNKTIANRNRMHRKKADESSSEGSQSSGDWSNSDSSNGKNGTEQHRDKSDSDSCQSSEPSTGIRRFKGGTKLANVEEPLSVQTHAPEDTVRKLSLDLRAPVSKKTQQSDVSRVLSLVERVTTQEQREWEEKQKRLERQIAAMSRRAYAPRWPFRPLSNLEYVRRVSKEGLHSWRKSEEERLRKRKKRLVQLRPQAGRQSAFALARCRKAYRPFLPNRQVLSLLQTHPKAKTKADKNARLFSKETLKQLNEVALSPTSVLDDAPKQTLQTLMHNNPQLRKLLAGSTSENAGLDLEEVLEDLPLNRGLRKELADKFAGLEALRNEKQVKSKPSNGNDGRMAKQLEVWAEGLLPRSHPKMREVAYMKLQDQLDLHQQKLLQIQAARFKDEVVKDQKAAAIKRAEAEELLFKTLLEKAVALEKEAILAQRREEREANISSQRDEESQRERAEEEIRRRCALLKEEIEAKRRERMEIERGQQQLLRQLAREERERLELERAMLLERLAVQAR